MSENPTEKVKTKGGKMALVICICIILILFIAVAALVYALVFNQEAEETPNDGKIRGVVVNEENAEKVMNDFLNRESVAPGYYEVTMNNDWVFPNGTTASENAYVENAESNSNAVYFDINLADSDELIYTSPVLPVGTHLDNIVPLRDLEKGNYDCVLTYHLLDESYENTISTLRMSLNIIVNE